MTIIWKKIYVIKNNDNECCVRSMDMLSRPGKEIMSDQQSNQQTTRTWEVTGKLHLQ